MKPVFKGIVFIVVLFASGQVFAKPKEVVIEPTVGKGATGFGKNVGVGTGKGAGKIGKGIGGEFKKLGRKSKKDERKNE